MKREFYIITILLHFSIAIQAQPSGDLFSDILTKLKDAEAYSTGISIEIKDKEGNLISRREAEVKKAGDNFYYRLDDSEVVLNDSLYIVIDHAAKQVQYAPKSIIRDPTINNLSEFIPESALNELQKRSRIQKAPAGWTISIPGQNGLYRNLSYVVGEQYELRRVAYTMQDDVSVDILYHNFQYQVDSNDEVFATRRILIDSETLTPAYQDYQLNNRN